MSTAINASSLRGIGDVLLVLLKGPFLSKTQNNFDPPYEEEFTNIIGGLFSKCAVRLYALSKMSVFSLSDGTIMASNPINPLSPKLSSIMLFKYLSNGD